MRKNILKWIVGTMAMWLLPTMAMAQYGKVYCSASEGDDANDGLTPRTALKTIARAAEKGRHIMLKRGDTFYERVALNGSKEHPYLLEGYGRGGKPVISGFKVARKGKGMWKQGRWDENRQWRESPQGDIWRLDTWDEALDGFTQDHSQWSCDIGCVYIPQSDKIYGIRCGFRTPDVEDIWLKNRQFSRNMKNDYDFFQQWGQDGQGRLEMKDDRYFYMKLMSDPNLQELWLSSGMTGVCSSFITLKGLKIWGWGDHGVGTGTNTNVKNCEIDIIGGSLFIGYSAGTRYGNGIEFYIASTKRDCLCEGNVISRTFDCGVTIQGAGFPGAYAENIVFRKNVIKDCRQSCEFWQVNATSETDKTLLDMKNCRFEHNVCYPTHSLYGQTSNANNSQILYYQGGGEIGGLTISDNTFIGGDTYYFNSGEYKVAQYKANRYICKPGAMLNRLAWRLPTEKDMVVQGDKDYTPQREGLYRYQTSFTETAYAPTLKEAVRKTVESFRQSIGDGDLKVIVKQQLPLKY